MHKFGLVVIGAHNASGLEELINNQTQKVLLIEPVHYNFNSLKEKFHSNKNVLLEKAGVSDSSEQKKFYFVKQDSITKLGKEWASGIGSFKKQHLLDHHRKRFKITEEDIGIDEIQIKTFSDVCKKYNITEIDFLFIDTEGHDYNIINSISNPSILEIDKPVSEEILQIRKLLESSIDEMELSVRSHNCLEAAGITLIGELVDKDEAEMLEYKNFGRKSLNELIEKLETMGLKFGMDTSPYTEDEA